MSDESSAEASKFASLSKVIGKVLVVFGGISVLLGFWAWVIPADWVKPQSLWNKPAPRVAAADVVRRWPSLGIAGVDWDSALVQVRGDNIAPTLRESGCRLVVFWSLKDGQNAGWHLGREATDSSPASVPMSVLTRGPWELSIAITCPRKYRGEIDLRPVLVKPQTFEEAVRLDSVPTSIAALPQGTAAGNNFPVETSGVTDGEPASPYRQVAQLSANVPIERFRTLLGAESTSAHTGYGQRRMFISSDYCVEAATDKNDHVVAYSVTALDEDFKPSFRYWNSDAWKTIALGSTSFAEVGRHPDGTFELVKADRYLYYQMFYWAAPGNYQTMFLGDNYLGYPRSATQTADRSATLPNTYGFCAPNANLKKALWRRDAGGIWIGPTAWDIGSVAGDGAGVSTSSSTEQP